VKTSFDGKGNLRRCEQVDALTSAAFRAFRRVLYLNRQAMPRVLERRGGMHHGEAFCLRLIVENDGVSQRDLADMVHLSRPRVTKILQALERKGAIDRKTDPHDQRLTRVFVTDAGRASEKKINKIFEEYLDRTVGTMAPEDREELTRLLGLLGDRIQEVLCEEDSLP